MMSEAKRTPLSDVPADAAHRVALLRGVPAGELLIHEIYLSVQGESTFAGLPCVFVRTSVCDSRCTWCDTPHAFNQGTRMSRAAVLDRALAFGCPLVELTGGEPLLQADVPPLMTELCDAGKTVLLETSGAHDVGRVDPRVHVIMDLKCPDSGESHRNRWANLNVLKPTDQIKFVLASRRDWDWAAAVIREHRLDERFTCLVSCVFTAVPPVELVGWLLESGLHRVRMQLQMHKYIWEPTRRGV
ncbi:7-carboxy-7-deazaguanine synthase [Frigoriglobus tundricola]|uniref:7-carboxy-7-deazaguanine synthase n=2 Tax=Frigoriglobus tundricola TaxID=2774151 RepID=A0A6M5YSR9_9BACT|nr:7-carboxy-7-deazaguanine synthase QueE [Frigoriglobus tundricola]QJW96460.1 7-carboxy-7-deazaguanine synthase [Frigoriglobus tundricola]